MKARLKSFGYAWNGIREVIKSEMNMKIHLAASVWVIMMAIVFSINYIEWLFVILCIALVLSAEIANTLVEKYLDHYHPHYDPKVGLIKDMAAAAVLILAVCSFVVGLIIFVPKIINLLT